MYIVVIDDNAEMFEEMFTALTQNFGLPDLEIEYYYSGEEFFAMLRKNPTRIHNIDFVFLDHSFNWENDEIDGESIYRELQRQREGIQVIGVSVEVNRQRKYLGDMALGKQQVIDPGWFLSWYHDHKGDKIK